MLRIKYWIFALVIWALFASCAHAQASDTEAPKAELFGGYSYLRVNPGGGVSGLDAPGGWHASIAGNFNSWFGLAGDFSGHYRRFLGVRANVHTFTFGPRFTARASERVQPFAHIQLGGARVSAGLGGIGASDTSFAAVLGTGVDVTFNKNVAWRVGQLDYLLTRFGGDSQHNFRFSTGIVFRFGSQ